MSKINESVIKEIERLILLISDEYKQLKEENARLREENKTISLQQESNLNTIKYFKKEVDELREAEELLRQICNYNCAGVVSNFDNDGDCVFCKNYRTEVGSSFYGQHSDDCLIFLSRLYFNKKALDQK